MEHKVTHFIAIPWTGLGLYGGYRGDRWLRNRIRVFKQFVLPSLLNQTNKNFVVWHAWRREERNNPIVVEFEEYMKLSGLENVFTFSGIYFWDDKYPDKEAKERLVTSLHGALQTLVNYTGDSTDVIYTLQPSDDCYISTMVEDTQKFFKENPDYQAVTYTKGLTMDYATGRLAEYNPSTNPPFFSIKFPKEVFIDPFKHMEYTGPFKSHEYIGNKLKLAKEEDERGFIVGIHFDNISTVFDHPYRGDFVDISVLKDFGLQDAGKLIIAFSIRRHFFKKLPYAVKRKLRYWSGDKKWILKPVFAVLYNFLRA